MQNSGQLTYEDVITKASTHMLKHHVSFNSISNRPESLPHGSGILVKFSIRIGQEQLLVYGILSASHVLYQSTIFTINNQQCLLLSKPINGKTVSCYANFCFIKHLASIVEFESGYTKEVNSIYAQDLAFMALSLNGNFPKHKLFEQSDFYDLDSANLLTSTDGQASFSGCFRGACLDKDIEEGVLTKTGPYLGGGETLKRDEKSQTSYWEVPNPKKQSMKGTSGAAFWRFFIKNNIIITLFSGIFTRQSKKREKLFATSQCYIQQVFLPPLKALCLSELNTQAIKKLILILRAITLR